MEPIKKEEFHSEQPHPMDAILRMDRMPHIWCPGCGLGTVISCFAAAVEECKIDYDRIPIVSGIGCTGRAAGYLHLDSYHTTHGRAVPFATGLHLANPELQVVVISGDGDIVAIGGNHLIHAARRNLDMTIICVNNFIYGMTGGQMAPTTPEGMKATTSPFGCLEKPFNLPYLVASSGATFVARWTTLDVRRMVDSFQRALTKKGFSFVEILSPCPELYMRRNKLGDGLTMMRQFQENRVIQHGADPKDADLGVTDRIIVGRFVDIDRPTYQDAYTKMCIQMREGAPQPQQEKESAKGSKPAKSSRGRGEKEKVLDVAAAPTGG